MTGIITYIVSLLLGVTAHDFHVSKSEIHYRSDEQAVQISINLFIDDLELALQSYSGEELKLFSKYEYASADSLISLYLSDHFVLEINGLTSPAQYLGKEISDDLMASWCYLEITNLEQVQSMSINNTIFYKEFDDQKNIVNFKKDRKSVAFHILDENEPNKEVNFE